MQRSTTQRNATQRNATQRNATQRNATQRNLCASFSQFSQNASFVFQRFNFPPEDDSAQEPSVATVLFELSSRIALSRHVVRGYRSR